LIPESEHFKKSACRLPVIRSELWQGYLFVNLSGDAPPLAPTLSAMEPTIRHYHPAEQHFLFSAEEVWQTNWKLLVENFMEGYHLSPTHATTLHPITPTRLCKKLADGPAFTGYRSNFDPNCPERGPYHPDLTEEERRSDVFYCVYPSFVVGFCPHFTLYMCIRPLTVDTVGIRWGITGNASDPNSTVVKDYIQLTREFSAEDRRELEALQAAMRSRHYTPGPLAPDDFEGTIWDLIQYMAHRFTSNEAKDPP
jgi:phenylpropionate dioxygenase-like ring-hydroxylating dioxygenase large terminal subunit